jgi:hypothetical protein
MGQSLLDSGFDMPQIGRLPHKASSFPQLREKWLIIGTKMVKDVFILVQTEVFTTNFDGDYLFVGQSWRESTPAKGLLANNCLIILAHQNVHHDDKILSRHRVVSFLSGLVRPPI